MPVIFFSQSLGKYEVYSAYTHQCIWVKTKTTILYPWCKFSKINCLLWSVYLLNQINFLCFKLSYDWHECFELKWSLKRTVLFWCFSSETHSVLRHYNIYSVLVNVLMLLVLQGRHLPLDRTCLQFQVRTMPYWIQSYCIGNIQANMMTCSRKQRWLSKTVIVFNGLNP